jgi:hypothetical protein
MTIPGLAVWIETPICVPATRSISMRETPAFASRLRMLARSLRSSASRSL